MKEKKKEEVLDEEDGIMGSRTKLIDVCQSRSCFAALSSKVCVLGISKFC